MLQHVSAFTIAMLALATLSVANDATDATRILQQHCASCHNPTKLRGGLDVTERERLIAGGDSGIVVVAGHPEESLLIQRVRDGSMPPVNDAPPLLGVEIDRLVRWVADGLDWPANKAGQERLPSVIENGPRQRSRHPLARRFLHRAFRR